MHATSHSRIVRSALTTALVAFAAVFTPIADACTRAVYFGKEGWRTMSDQKNRVYYFENTASPSPVWVRLANIDFKEGSGIRKLPLVGKLDLGGDQTDNFVKAEPFKFLAPD